MTIAAGFVCSNGIILCADTQETIVGYTKNSTEKIRIYEAELGIEIAITGAGDTELIETIGADVERALIGAYSPDGYTSPNHLKETIQGTMESCFRRYIAPYAAFPKDDRPWCELLILVSIKNKINNYECLFKTTGTTAREITFGAECIGTGLILAKSLIERFYNAPLDLDEALLTSLYIMYQTKKWVDGCGGKTDILISSTRKNILTSLCSMDVESIEEHLEDCEGYANLILIGLLNPNRDQAEINRISNIAANARKAAIESLYANGSHLSELFKRLRN